MSSIDKINRAAPTVRTERRRALRDLDPSLGTAGVWLIVSDIEAAHKELVAKGINVSEVFHGSPFSRISGPDPERKRYGSYVSFEDPDGNVWIVQEVTRRLPGRIDPAMTTFTSANDLASAMRRAAAAHGENEKRNGQHDADWPDWYAVYMAAERAGTELPK